MTKSHIGNDTCNVIKYRYSGCVQVSCNTSTPCVTFMLAMYFPNVWIGIRDCMDMVPVISHVIITQGSSTQRNHVCDLNLGIYGNSQI